MNKTGLPTYDKILMPLRLPPETYQKMMDMVHKQKKKQRGFSANQFLTTLVEKELDIKQNR